MSETESESTDDEAEIEEQLDDVPTVTVEIPLDGVHEQMYDGLDRGADNLDALIAANLREPFESTVYKLYQNGKYDQGQ